MLFGDKDRNWPPVLLLICAVSSLGDVGCYCPCSLDTSSSVRIYVVLSQRIITPTLLFSYCVWSVLNSGLNTEAKRQ